MQIHELDTYIGTPSETDYMAVDDGTETFKIPLPSVGVTTQMTLAEAEAGTETAPRVITPAVLNSFVTKESVLVIEVASFSSLPQTVTNANITEDMVVVNSVLGTPSAQTSDWTVTTSDGSLTIAGSISGSTALTLYLNIAK